jgi:hypothetical protein
MNQPTFGEKSLLNSLVQGISVIHFNGIRVGGGSLNVPDLELRVVGFAVPISPRGLADHVSSGRLRDAMKTLQGSLRAFAAMLGSGI